MTTQALEPLPTGRAPTTTAHLTKSTTTKWTSVFSLPYRRKLVLKSVLFGKESMKKNKDDTKEEEKDNSLQKERSYYISNGLAKENNEYFEAIRNHWAVEVNHHLRDVTLKEDHLRTKKNEITRIFSGLRTLVLEILRLLKPKKTSIIIACEDSVSAPTYFEKILKKLI